MYWYVRTYNVNMSHATIITSMYDKLFVGYEIKCAVIQSITTLLLEIATATLIVYKFNNHVL